MDKYEFDRKVAMWNITLAILLTIGGALFAAGIAFLTTGAAEVNHGMDLKGVSQDRVLSTAFNFLDLGAEIFVLGLLIISVSGITISTYVHKLSISIQPDVSKLDNTQKSDHPDSSETDRRDEEIKNAKIRLDIENIKAELANLKLEAATIKLEQIKNKTDAINHKSQRTNTKSKRR